MDPDDHHRVDGRGEHVDRSAAHRRPDRRLGADTADLPADLPGLRRRRRAGRGDRADGRILTDPPSWLLLRVAVRRHHARHVAGLRSLRRPRSGAAGGTAELGLADPVPGVDLPHRRGRADPDAAQGEPHLRGAGEAGPGRRAPAKGGIPHVASDPVARYRSADGGERWLVRLPDPGHHLRQQAGRADLDRPAGRRHRCRARVLHDPVRRLAVRQVRPDEGLQGGCAHPTGPRIGRVAAAVPWASRS